MKKNNTLNTLVIGLSFLAIGLMLGLVFSNTKSSKTANETPQVENSEPQTLEEMIAELEFVSVSEGDSPFLGSEDAPVTIVEFSDYQCPYCAKFNSETLPLIKENYIDKGLVKLVYREFPIPKHANAQTASISAQCVAENGGSEAYFEMSDLIFTNMQEWFYEENPAGMFATYASSLGYEIASCMNSEEVLAKVNADYSAGRSYGVSGTPTFFVNGKKLVGAYPYEVFETLIQSELNQ